MIGRRRKGDDGGVTKERRGRDRYRHGRERGSEGLAREAKNGKIDGTDIRIVEEQTQKRMKILVEKRVED